MKQPINRREFITASAAVAAGLGLGAGSSRISFEERSRRLDLILAGT